MRGDSRCLRVFKSGKLDLKITWSLPQVPSVSWCVSLASCDMIKWYWDGYTWCSDKYNIQQTLMITSETEKKKWGMARDPGNMTFGLTRPDILSCRRDRRDFYGVWRNTWVYLYLKIWKDIPINVSQDVLVWISNCVKISKILQSLSQNFTSIEKVSFNVNVISNHAAIDIVSDHVVKRYNYMKWRI